MKKTNFYELFVYAIGIICLVMIIINTSGVLNNIATLLLPQSAAMEEYMPEDTSYVYRSLISTVPMLIGTLFGFIWSIKTSAKIRHENATVVINDK